MLGVLTGTRASRTRRILIVTAAAACFVSLGSLLTEASFGLFSTATPATEKTARAGTVTQADDVTGSCSIRNLLPDGAPRTCTLRVTYTGHEPGWLALDVSIQTQAGSGGTTLYNPGDGVNGLQVAIGSTSPSVTY